jgi:DNA invertase Pin-like site-specific DNA recombinase
MAGRPGCWKRFDLTGRQRRLRPDERKRFAGQARQMRADGYTRKAIGAALGFSEPTIFQWTADINPVIEQRRVRDARIRELRAEGLCGRTIARQVPCSIATVWRVLADLRADIDRVPLS